VGIATIKRHLPDMTKRTTCASGGREDSSAILVLFFALALLVVTASAMDMGGADGSGASKPRDLTGLSLRELYDMDIVQPNVLGGHTHTAGQIMLGYEYMHTHMAGLYQGSGQVSPATVFAEGFGTVHTSMDMDMHMVDVMYAPTERLTLMAMLPYKQMTMQHLTSTHTTFVQNADGVGDLEAMGLITILGDVHSGGRLILNLGVSFPTGSINVHDHASGNPNNPEVLLEYFMQMGSGTYDLLPGLTYLGDYESWAWGAQTLETVRFGRNDHGYRLGDEYGLSGWAAYGVTDWFAPSVRLNGQWWNNITGDDPGLAHNTTPEARPNLRAGRRLDLLMGLNFYVPKGFLKGNRLMIEGGFPVYQYLSGPQLGTAWMLNVGWTYAF
jgi:hypothetical protein